MVEYQPKKNQSSPRACPLRRHLYPETAEQALAGRKMRHVMFGRQLIADLDMPATSPEGQEEDVPSLLYCNQICVGRLYENW